MLNDAQMAEYRRLRAQGTGISSALHAIRFAERRQQANDVELHWVGDEDAEGTVTIEGEEYTVKVVVTPDDDWYSYDAFEGKEGDSLPYSAAFPDPQYLAKGLPLTREEILFFYRHDNAILSVRERAYRERNHEPSSSYARRMAREEWGVYFLPENDWRTDWIYYRRHGMARHEAYLKALQHALDDADRYSRRGDSYVAYTVTATVEDEDGVELDTAGMGGCDVDWHDFQNARDYLREMGQELADEVVHRVREAKRAEREQREARENAYLGRLAVL